MCCFTLLKKKNLTTGIICQIDCLTTSVSMKTHQYWFTYPNEGNKLLVRVFVISGRVKTMANKICYSWLTLRPYKYAGQSTHLLYSQVSMASAIGNWCVTETLLMYWLILPATSTPSAAGAAGREGEQTVSLSQSVGSARLTGSELTNPLTKEDMGQLAERASSTLIPLICWSRQIKFPKTHARMLSAQWNWFVK